MKTATKLQNALSQLGIEELKFCAIQYKNETSVQALIIADKINDRLIELMPAGEFEKFADKELF